MLAPGTSQAFECLFEFVHPSDWYALCTASKLFNAIVKRFVQRIQNEEYRSWGCLLWLLTFADLTYVDICTLIIHSNRMIEKTLNHHYRKGQKVG